MATSMLAPSVPLPRCQRTFRVVSARAPSKHSNTTPTATGPPPDMSYVLRSKGGSGYGILKILVRDKPHVTLLLAARLPPGADDVDDNDEATNNSSSSGSTSTSPVKRSEKKTAWLWARFHPRHGTKPPGAPLAPARPLITPTPNTNTSGQRDTHAEDRSDKVVIKVTHKQRRVVGVMSSEERAARAEIAALQELSSSSSSSSSSPGDEGSNACCDGVVVRLLEAMEDEHAIYAVLPYLPGQDLHRYMRATGSAKQGLGEEQARHIGTQVGKALLHMKTHHGLAHGDVCLENVMMLGDGSVRLVDLGLAVKASTPSPSSSSTSPRKASASSASVSPVTLDSDAEALLSPRGVRGLSSPSPFAQPSPSLSALSRSPQRGRPCYACPEGVRQRGRVEAYGGDVWCLGVLLFYSLLGLPSCPLTAMDLLCGAHLGSNGEGGGVEALMAHYLRQFSGRRTSPTSTSSSSSKTQGGPTSPTTPAAAVSVELSAAAKDLLGGMLCPDPVRRLRIEQVLEHEWIKGHRGAAAEQEGSVIERGEQGDGESHQ